MSVRMYCSSLYVIERPGPAVLKNQSSLTTNYMSQKSWPMLYCNLRYEMGQTFWTYSITFDRVRPVLLKAFKRDINLEVNKLLEYQA